MDRREHWNCAISDRIDRPDARHGSRRPAGGRGQTATIGFVLIFGFTLFAASLVLGLGGEALFEAEQRLELQRAEQSLTMYDSRSASVAVGASDAEQLDFSGHDGTYRVAPNAGQIRIVHRNYTGTGADTTILEPTPLGALVYENGDESVAYQAGGVWRKRAGEASEMVAPPEFDYGETTLTFPIVLTRGSGSVTGASRAQIRTQGSVERVYPNSTATYPDGSSYLNPVTNGTVVVEIESNYSDAWGEYFETHTQGNVSYPSDGTVRVALVGVDDLGAFQMPGESGSIIVPGAEAGHSVDAFSLTIRPDDRDAADFNNLQWSLYAETGDQQFELHLSKGSNSGCGDDPLTLDATIYYSADGGSTYHGWHRDDAYTASCDDLDGDGDEEIYFRLPLVDDGDGDGATDDNETRDAALTYGSLSNSDLGRFDPGGSSLADPTLDGHDGAWEPLTPAAGDALTTDRLVNHYFARLPNEFELTVTDQNSDTVNEDASHGVIHTTGHGRFVTYLHVSSNRVEVDLR